MKWQIVNKWMDSAYFKYCTLSVTHIKFIVSPHEIINMSPVNVDISLALHEVIPPFIWTLIFLHFLVRAHNKTDVTGKLFVSNQRCSDYSDS